MAKPLRRNPEGSIRKGVIQGNACRQQFAVTVGTVFADSQVPLNKWLLANHMIVSSQKGISAHQLHRMLGVTYKTSWLMTHRIREAMISTDDIPTSEGGGTIKADGAALIGSRPG